MKEEGQMEKGPKSSCFFMLLLATLFLFSFCVIFPQSVFAKDPLPSQEMETTLFDLYLADKSQGLILVRFTDQWCEVVEPSDLVDQLPQLRDRQPIIELVTGQIIGEQKKEGIGLVRCDVYSFRITVNVDPQNLLEKPLTLSDRLPDPENKFSFNQNVYVTSAGTVDKDFNSAFTSRSLASVGKYWANIDGTAVEDRPFELDNLSGSGIIGDYRMDLGMLRTKGQEFAGSADYAGVAVETSKDMILDQDLLQGSRLQIYVPSRSRVEFYRGGRLLSVQILDFGLQEVDTSDFPDGSYQVDVLIKEDGGQETRERHFFTKSGYLTVRSKPIYTVQAGVLRKEFSIKDTPVFQTGARVRALDSVDLESAISGTDKVRIGSVGFTGLWGDYRLGSSFSYSDQGHAGVSGVIDGILPWEVRYNVSGSKTLNPEPSTKQLPQEDQAPEDPFFPLFREKDNNIDVISRERNTLYASVIRTFDRVNMRFVGNSNESEVSRRRYAYGPVLEWTFFLQRQHTARLILSYLETNDGERGAALISYRVNFRPWSILTEAAGRVQSSGEKDLGGVDINYDSRNRSQRGVRGRFSSELKEGGQNKKGLSEVNTAELGLANRFLESSVFARNNESAAAEQTNIGINAGSSFMLSQDLGVSVSNPAPGEAALIVETTTRTPGLPLEVLVDNQVYDLMKSGQRMVVKLMPYRSYRVSIRPTEEAPLLRYDNEAFAFSVFPGNVLKKTWKIDKTFLVLGRLVDKNGKPIPFQRIKGVKEYVVTEEDGSFQAEISGSEELRVESSLYQCKLPLTVPEEVEFIYDLGEIRCE